MNIFKHVLKIANFTIFSMCMVLTYQLADKGLHLAALWVFFMSMLIMVGLPESLRRRKCELTLMKKALIATADKITSSDELVKELARNQVLYAQMSKISALQSEMLGDVNMEILRGLGSGDPTDAVNKSFEVMQEASAKLDLLKKTEEMNNE